MGDLTVDCCHCHCTRWPLPIHFISLVISQTCHRITAELEVLYVRRGWRHQEKSCCSEGLHLEFAALHIHLIFHTLLREVGLDFVEASSKSLSPGLLAGT